MKELPIYRINKFEIEHNEGEFYTNYVNNHVKKHDFTNFPHKHDFFLVILFTKFDYSILIPIYSYKKWVYPRNFYLSTQALCILF